MLLPIGLSIGAKNLFPKLDVSSSYDTNLVIIIQGDIRVVLKCIVL